MADTDREALARDTPEMQLLFLVQSRMQGVGWSDRADEMHRAILSRWRLVPVDEPGVAEQVQTVDAPQWFCADCQDMRPQGHRHNDWFNGTADA